MFWEFVEKIENEFSGARAKRHAEAIFSWDHTMDFRNFYKSAKYCAESIREAGLGDVEIIRYPADGKGRIGDYVALQAWDVNDAELKIIEPVSEARTIARYREEPLSLAMFSAPTPPEGIDAELILIEQKLPDPQECKGKIAFVTQESPHLFAALEGGAIGYISDSIFSIPHIRDRWAIPDAVCWNFLGPNWPLSFLDPRNKRQHFGYIIPPREGAKLMNTIKRADKEGQKVKAHAWVDSKLYDGDFPLVTGVIPGIQSDREMLLAAHLFEPGALDNAAGCGIALEMARVLNKLILGGHLPKPQMTLRFMFSFEFYGIAAYVSHTEEKAKRIAGSIYFDCIGADQALTKAPLNVVKMPEARPSFLDSLLLHMMHAYYERRDPYFKVGENPIFMVDSMIRWWQRTPWSTSI